MRRKLLPYEYDLIKALKVTEEEYLDFLTAQYDYTQSVAERQGIIRAEPLSTIALVLTVVGVIFQVAAALFAQPEEKTQRQRRQERFSPRYGFNTTQELAQYGDPVNLIYCSTRDNPDGGVRAGTALVWSAIESCGASQFLQVLLVLGAARVLELDEDRFAFGQLSLRQVIPSKLWLYYSRNGRVTYKDRLIGIGGLGTDPTHIGSTDNKDDVCQLTDGNKRKEGFSQAFSPTSMNVYGVYAPIPINVDIQERSSSGKVKEGPLNVTIAGDSYDAKGGRWRKGDRFKLLFKKVKDDKDNRGDVVQETAEDMRYGYVSSLDPASTYKLGTAKFRLIEITEDPNLDKREVFAKFECIEGGLVPYTNYGQTKPTEYDEEDRIQLDEAVTILSSPYEESTARGGGTLEGGRIGATLMPAFQSTRSYRDRDEDSADTLQTQDFVIDVFGIKYKFKGEEVVKWETDVQDLKSQDFIKGKFEIPRGGSIAYTKRLYKEFLSNKPKIETKELRRSYESDLEDLRQLIDEIAAGKEDKELESKGPKNSYIQKLKEDIDELQSRLKDVDDKRYSESLRKNTNDDGLLKAKGTDFDPKESKAVKEILKKIEELRDKKEEFLRGDLATKRSLAIKDLRNDRTNFTWNGRTFSGGVRYVKEKLRNLKGEFTTDQRGTNEVRRAFRALIAEKEEALKFAKYVTKNWEMLMGAADDHFYTKCIVKSEEAVYQTVTRCDYVKLALRCRVFRNISGRAKKYGEKDAPDGFLNSDNGYKSRIAMFKLFYKASKADNWRSPPVIFAVRRRADQDNFVAINFQGARAQKWEFKLEPINDMGAELLDSGQDHFAFLENAGKQDRFFDDGNEFRFVGDLVKVNRGLLRPEGEERGPVMTNEWDLFSTRSDSQLQGSFDSGPEFQVAAVTEQQLGSLRGKYDQLSMLALGVYSGLGMQDLRAVTAYVTEGKACYRINPENGNYSKSGERSSSWAPDIFADTVLDNLNGIGKYAVPDAVDWDTLALSKRFCMNNGICRLHMDGVIADRTSWRQFWAEVAPYSLLEFARIGGRETLIPAVPVNDEGRITRRVPIASLFNQGNIFEGSYREQFLDYGTDVEDIIATVIYRDTELEDVFPRNASVTVRRRGISEDTAIRQVFDLSQFVTSRRQSILYGKLMCNQRRFVKRAIEFKTYPTATPVSPGAYILVDIGLKTWDPIRTGIILEGGYLDMPLETNLRAGNYPIMIYRLGNDPIVLDSVAINDNKTAPSLADYINKLFVIGRPSDTKRVFRVTEVQMDEEGEVTVRATDYPCEDDDGVLKSRIADFRDDDFEID
jgi:hypothetical protein